MAVQNKRTDDPLWKSVLEQTFKDFLLFFFKDVEQTLDLERGFEFLDKELETLFAPEANNKGVLYVDKLVKVHRKDGGEQFVLCHIEVQSHKGKNDLEQRMFQYFCRIYDKYKVPITAIAILADGNKKYRPEVFTQDFMGTELNYKFNAFKIINHQEKDLRQNQNPFAVVILTALMAIQQKKISDHDLLITKRDLLNEMLKREMPELSRQAIYDFLARYVNFENTEIFNTFENEVIEKLGLKKTNRMTTREYLLDKARKEGIAIERARANAEHAVEKQAEKNAIALAFKRSGISQKMIAENTGLSEEDVAALVIN